LKNKGFLTLVILGHIIKVKYECLRSTGLNGRLGVGGTGQEVHDEGDALAGVNYSPAESVPG
jgi:hypothetical protein